MHSSRFLAFALLVGLASLAHAGRSNSLMDVSPDGGRLLVSNSDNGTVSVVDTKAKKVLHEIKVGDKPEGVTWVGRGPMAVVTVYKENAVVFFDADRGKVVKKLKVSHEPYGIVADDEGRHAWVTHEYPGTVSEIDLKAQKVVREIKVGNYVRGISLSADGGRLYVTEFYTAQLLAVDLKKGKVVDAWKNQSLDNLCRNVVVHPTRPKAYLPHIRSRVNVIHGAGSIFPQFTIFDLVSPDKGKRRTSIAMDSFNGVYVVTNPWESAITPDGKRLFVVYAGTDDMNVCKVIDDDYREMARIGLPLRVGKNPRAVRVSPDGKTLYVSNALDFNVGVYDITGQRPRLETNVKVCDPPKTPEWVRGKVLFSVSNRQTSGPRWIACASCHPDGHSDGRVWQNPEGKRRTPPLMGLAHTHPIHYSGDRDEVQDFEYTIRGRLMQGSGLLRERIKPKDGFNKTELEETTSGRSADLDALAIYTNSFDFTLSPHIAAPGKLSPEAERGKTLFFSKEVGCAKCHSGPYYTDSSLTKPFKLYDVGTGGDADEKMGPKYDTPTLLGVYRAPPYLHNGKAKTLRDVLTACNKEDRHGKTSHLKSEQIDEMVAFLKSLPYEQPPTETPNTVKYRVTPKKD
jgi:YVTN family beta-propeller protein